MLKQLIKPMVKTMVRDAICQLIANERDEQIKIARSLGMSEKEIENQIDFTVFPKRYRIPDIIDMPCVYVYFDRADFPQELQAINGNFSKANLQIEFYCAGNTSFKIDKNHKHNTITADANADDRLEYLSAQLYNILFSENNVSLGTNKIVKHRCLKSWNRILTPEELNQATTVLGASFSIELGFDEPTYYNDTFKIKEFYTTLHIKQEFIDPFMRVILDS